jgi:hypothetical protein
MKSRAVRFASAIAIVGVLIHLGSDSTKGAGWSADEPDAAPAQSKSTAGLG